MIEPDTDILNRLCEKNNEYKFFLAFKDNNRNKIKRDNIIKYLKETAKAEESKDFSIGYNHDTYSKSGWFIIRSNIAIPKEISGEE